MMLDLTKDYSELEMLSKLDHIPDKEDGKPLKDSDWISDFNI